MKFNLVLFSFLCFSFFSCKESQSQIFEKGNTWEFNAYRIDKNGGIYDSIPLQLTVKRNWVAMITGQIPLIYIYSNNGKTYKELTGAIDNNNEVSIHSPRLGIFSFTEILPMPSISKPFGNNFESSIETIVSKSTMKVLNGKVIKQNAKYEGVDSLNIMGESLPCFKINTENLNLYELVGHYKASYWFNDKYGFVRLLYFIPDGEKIDIQLIK